MQQHLQESDKRIEEVFRRLDEGNAKPKQGVFYNGRIIMYKFMRIINYISSIKVAPSKQYNIL